MRSIRVVSETPGETPEELNWLKKYLKKIEIGNTHVQRGVYFLCEQGDVQYVGSTGSVLTRLTAHAKKKDFDEVFFLPVEADEVILREIEYRFIDFFDPLYNKKKNYSPRFPESDIRRVLEKTENISGPDLPSDERLKSMGDEIKERRKTHFEDFIKYSLYDEIKEMCANVFGDRSWLVNTRWHKIRKIAEEILNSRDYSYNEFDEYRLATRLAVLVIREEQLEKGIGKYEKILNLERRKQELERRVGEFEDIENLKRRKRSLELEIKQLERRRERYSRNLPDIIA